MPHQPAPGLLSGVVEPWSVPLCSPETSALQPLPLSVGGTSCAGSRPILMVCPLLAGPFLLMYSWVFAVPLARLLYRQGIRWRTAQMCQWLGSHSDHSADLSGPASLYVAVCPWPGRDCEVICSCPERQVGQFSLMSSGYTCLACVAWNIYIYIYSYVPLTTEWMKALFPPIWVTLVMEKKKNISQDFYWTTEALFLISF